MNTTTNIAIYRRIHTKYAPAMCGLINNFTNDRRVTVDIFAKAFTELKNDHLLGNLDFAPVPHLLRHTYNCTLMYLESRGISFDEINPLSNMPVLLLFCTRNITIKEAADHLNMTEAKVVKQLDADLLELSNKTVRPHSN